MDPGFARELTRRQTGGNGMGMPPGVGAEADAEEVPYFGADDGDDALE